MLQHVFYKIVQTTCLICFNCMTKLKVPNGGFWGDVIRFHIEGVNFFKKS